MIHKCKRCITIFFALSLFAIQCKGESGTDSLYVSSVDDLVKKVDFELDNNISEAFNMTQVFSHFRFVKSFPALVDATTNNWVLVVENLDSIVSNDDERVILLHAFLFLPPDAYIEFLYHVLDLYKDKKITRNELFVLTIRPPNNKCWLLSYNYKDPTVINFLNSFEKAVEGDGDLEDAAEFIRSGKAKKRDMFLRQNKNKKYYEMNPIPFLSTAGASEPNKSAFNEITMFIEPLYVITLGNVSSAKHITFITVVLILVGLLIWSIIKRKRMKK